MVRVPIRILFHSMIVMTVVNPLRVSGGMLMIPLVFLPLLVLGVVGLPFTGLLHCMMMAFLTFSTSEWRSHRVLIEMTMLLSFYMLMVSTFGIHSVVIVANSHVWSMPSSSPCSIMQDVARNEISSVGNEWLVRRQER